MICPRCGYCSENLGFKIFPTQEYEDREWVADFWRRLEFYLTVRQYEILHAYYLEGHTMAEIAQGLKLTGERVRQIRQVALRRLSRHHGKELLRFLENYNLYPREEGQ